MLRLFIGLIAFLAVALGGWWYSTSSGTPLDEATFENASLQLEGRVEQSKPPETTVPQSEPKTAPKTMVAEKKAVESAPESTPKFAELSVPEKSEPSRLSIQPRLLRFGFRVPPSSRLIDTIVLHSSYNAGDGDEYDVEKTISQYETYGVGAHYIIDRKGTIYRLIDEANIAYHAGASKMPDGRQNVNDFSIGIEMIANLEDGYTDKQYVAVNALIADIKTRYKITNVVGHSDIAPSRKTDPWKFDWKKLK